jgi:porin
MGTCGLLLLMAVLAQEPSSLDQPPRKRAWLEGDHLTGDWGGDRDALANHGISIDVSYATEVFANISRVSIALPGIAFLGHVDASLTIATQKLGLWRGGKFFLLAQNNLGTGINTFVGSAAPITNLEAAPYTQLTEYFYEQTLFDDHLLIRLGKQDANRDFGTPRFTGDFLNSNFGMFPTAPLPSYPTTALGATVVVTASSWLTLRTALYEGVDTGFTKDPGLTFILDAALEHTLGPVQRGGGTTSLGLWREGGTFPDLTEDPNESAVLSSSWGVFFQHDERVYSNPSDPEDRTGLFFTARLSWSQPDRTRIPLYAGASIAWHGLGQWRKTDRVGVGFGYFTVTGSGSEGFIETFYRFQLTPFLIVQPDLQYYRHPGGDGPDALLAGVRLRIQL